MLDERLEVMDEIQWNHTSALISQLITWSPKYTKGRAVDPTTINPYAKKRKKKSLPTLADPMVRDQLKQIFSKDK
jgi:hypothetical protein